MLEVVRTPRLRIATELRAAKGVWASELHAEDFKGAHADWSEEPSSPADDIPLPAISEDLNNRNTTDVAEAAALSRPSSAQGNADGGCVVKRLGPRKPPARPPKPRPHRPITFSCSLQGGDSEGGGDGEAAKPKCVRWTSSLRPIWPDRLAGTSEEAAADPPTPSAEVAPATSGADTPPPDSVATLLQQQQEPAASGSDLALRADRSHRDPVKEAASISIASIAAVEAARREESLRLAERTRHMEQSSRRLRENMERLRCENRRARIFGPERSSLREQDSPSAVPSASSPTSPTSGEFVPKEKSQQLLDMLRKIEELDRVQALEKERLEKQQKEAEERWREQVEFERTIREQTERAQVARKEREACEDQALKLREDRERRELEERSKRWREKQREDQERSKRLEENRLEGRSDAATLKWQLLEQELDRQWADEEAEEHRRMQEYASIRRRQYEEWDKKLLSERQRFGMEAEFRDAAQYHKVLNAADSDEKFYGPQRATARGGAAPHPPTSGRGSARRPLPSILPEVSSADMKGMPPEEQAVLKELRSVLGSSRDIQKAKVKELLFMWHPDKNPSCAEKAKRVFQFVQKHRQTVLGL